MPKMMVWKVLHKRLCFEPYKMRLLQALTPTTFHISRKVNRHNVRIWQTEQPHTQLEHQCDSPKVNVFCAVSREKVHDPFSSLQQLWLATHLWTCWKTGYYPNWRPIMTITFYNWMELPPHFHINVWVLLNCILPQCWIRRAANGDNNLLPWPLHSLNLTPCDFFLLGFVKYSIYVSPLPCPSRNFVTR
jgi:hypothetical protein